MGVFTFLNSTNGTKSRKTSHIFLPITPMEDIFVCERLLFELVIIKVKDEKNTAQNVKHTM